MKYNKDYLCFSLFDTYKIVVNKATNEVVKYGDGYVIHESLCSRNETEVQEWLKSE